VFRLSVNISLTCGHVLIMQEEGSSLYPNEIDELFGDPLLFKVNKKFSGGEGSAMVYEVLEMFDDPSLINVYVNPFHSVYGPLVSFVVVVPWFRNLYII
jgi:hypothetical protein